MFRKTPIQNSHPSIVSQDAYDLVQQELKKRKGDKGYKTSASVFSGNVICGECKSHYGSKVWHSTSKYKRTIWQCNSKFKNDEKCSTPHLYEDALKQAFIGVVNTIISNRDEILCEYKAIIRTLSDTTETDDEIHKWKAELETVMKLLRRCVDDNAHSTLDQAEYTRRYDDLIQRHDAAKAGIARLEEVRTQHKVRDGNIRKFLKALSTQVNLVTEFDEDFWHIAVDNVTVYTGGRFSFAFKDGRTVEWG